MTTSQAADQRKENPAPGPVEPEPNRSLAAEEVEAQEKLENEFDQKEDDLGGAKDRVDRDRA